MHIISLSTAPAGPDPRRPVGEPISPSRRHPSSDAAEAIRVLRSASIAQVFLSRERQPFGMPWIMCPVDPAVFPEIEILIGAE